MATYSNPHWLLCHIRNSFISTDDTGMCETVMVSDDLPKHYLRKYQGNSLTRYVQQQQQHRRSLGSTPQQQQQQTTHHRNYDPILQEVDFVCYPGLDQSDDEDVDLTAQSFDIQMYPEVGAHRFRSNTAQKLEKMDIARRKAAKTKCVNYDDDIVQPERNDFFVRKFIGSQEKLMHQNEGIKSKLTLQLANSPKQVQNKFQEYAKFDGTSQTGVQTKRINVFLSMLPEKERNYPIKICVLSHAKISDVIGLVCYKATVEFPDLPLKSIRHYGLYMTEDNDDLEDFPPLDHREPCSKFGFSHLTLAERRPMGIERDYGQPTKSMTSEEEKARLAAMALHSLNCTGVGSDGFHSPEDKDDVDGSNNIFVAEGRVDDLEQRILSQDDMLEAPVYRSYNLNIIDKKFFKTEVSLGISGERIEIDQQKNAKFWTKQRAVIYPIDAVAHCEIVEMRTVKAVLRIWLKTASAISSSAFSDNKTSLSIPAHSPTSPGHYPHYSSPFNFLNNSSSTSSSSSQQIRFKHYDFETTIPMAEQIYKKLSCILDMCSSDVRREFLQVKQRKLEKIQAKKHLKLL
ncbi:stress-activated map kinase-interacting protein 1 isoform X1 [Lucilia cuprina]|uniref:stress-activated map kinase-interacting protein 1 isoform X1 n=1 Tax=Lucilia cuprina TaxID=7375 RepID=UPI001F066563|nr:stress-activated map kinase-interacting protein 1 isoform X1 [Lucilia cuprina]